MKAAVLSFPGSNCDQDLLWATRLVAGATAELVPASARTLTGFDVVMIPGGFSYGDYLCSGAIASLAPIMAAVQRFAAAGGYIIGICNGFQILTAAGLLPGALQSNAQLDFVCAPAPLTVVNNSTAFTNAYADGARSPCPLLMVRVTTTRMRIRLRRWSGTTRWFSGTNTIRMGVRMILPALPTVLVTCWA